MHVYIHVPFCGRRCSYCDFAIAVRREAPSEKFADTVVAEWRAWLDAPWWAEVGPIATIYFGGGTPSRVDPDALGRVLAAIKAERTVETGAEITVEANPEDVDDRLVERWMALGINRVSLGVQSFDAEVLRWMHRLHGPDQPERAVAALRTGGMPRVSLDLIYGLPAKLGRDWPADLERALALDVDHLSLYGLTVEERTPLGRWVMRGAIPAPDDGLGADQYLFAHDRLTAAGMVHYEISNAGRPGSEARHNQAYWRRATYLGLGPSSHSAHQADRWWNEREWERYAAVVGPGRRAVAGRESLGPDQVELERLYLGLRTLSGVPASSLPEQTVDQWLAAGWARRVDSRVVLEPQGWLRLDALVARAMRT